MANGLTGQPAVALPTFVVAGTQKAATTWLYECLREHPEVFVSRPKELHFFCPKGQCWKSRADLGLEWYRAQFPETGYKALGELSIDYMFYPDVARQIAALNPKTRVLFILRNPVERAYSAYWMHRRGKAGMPPFAEFVRPDSDFVARGLYWHQIERYLAVLPREQIKVLIYESIRTDPKAFLSTVYRFVGVMDDFSPPSVHQNIGATKELPPMLSRLFYRKVSPILQHPVAAATWRAVKRTTGINRVREGAPSTSYAPLGAEEGARLRSLYREENERLFEFLGFRVAQWTD